MRVFIVSLTLSFCLASQIGQTFAQERPQRGGEVQFEVEYTDIPPEEMAPPPPIPDYISNKRVQFTPQEKEAIRLAKKWEQNALNPNIALDGGKILFAYGAATPTIICAPLHISDLELQQGEIVNDVMIGDSARWHADIVRVGTEEAATPHILFKPLDAGLETSVVIATNRRAYHVNLKSQRDTYIPFSGFLFPVEIHNKLSTAAAKVENQSEHRANADGVDISKLDFEYEVIGKAHFRPVQVYNDGIKTYIKMPSTVAQSEMPVLLVENKTGRALVNYRVRNNSYVVDQLFGTAHLILGVGSDQEKITVVWRKS